MAKKNQLKVLGFEWGDIAPLHLTSRVLADGLYVGSHLSRKKGAGIEFGGFRAYSPGDDLRFLDKRNLMLRDRLVLKQFETETDRAFRVLLDASFSMSYRGHLGRASKYAYSALLAAALARVAVAQGDPISFGFLGEQYTLSRFISAQKDAFSIFLNELEKKIPEGHLDSKKTEFLAEKMKLIRSSKKGSVMLMISDFLDLDLLHTLKNFISHLSRQGVVLVALRLLDPDELLFPFDGGVRLKAMETTQVLETSHHMRADYINKLKAHMDQMESLFLAQGGGWVEAQTNDLPINVLRSLIFHFSRIKR